MQAFAKALRMRRSADYGLDSAVCVYDLAQRLGIEVRFLAIPSMEGMYYKKPSENSNFHLIRLSSKWIMAIWIMASLWRVKTS